MVRALESKRGTLTQRLTMALVAGARAGGDRRTMESSTMLAVHREPRFNPAWSDRWVDLRVDQHPRPVAELGRILRRQEDENGHSSPRARRLRRRRSR